MKTHALQARALQNWAKEAILGQLVPAHADVLCELYCGGAALDVGKYERAGIGQYVAVDTSQESLDKTGNAIQRKGHPFRATFINTDPTQEGFLPAIRSQVEGLQFNHVVCFSGLHQPGRLTSERRAARLLHNVHACLAPNGFFFGMLPDSATVWSRTQGADLDSRQGDLYTVKCTQRPGVDASLEASPFGTMEFQLRISGEVEATEGSLIHFATFQKLAENAGFKVWEIINLVEFYHMHKHRQRKQLLAYQVISDKVTSLDKPNADVASFFAIFILQKKSPRTLKLESHQQNVLLSDDLEPESPHYHFAANMARHTQHTPLK